MGMRVLAIRRNAHYPLAWVARAMKLILIVYSPTKINAVNTKAGFVAAVVNGCCVAIAHFLIFAAVSFYCSIRLTLNFIRINRKF